MFEEYLEDAYSFVNLAREATDERAAKRYYRASVFCTASAMEAFVNYVADTISKGGPLQPHEIAFISDKKFVFEQNKPQLLVEKNENHKLDDKLGLLIKKFIKEFDFKTDADWKNIIEFKKFRDSLVHPRKAEDDVSSSDYDALMQKSEKSAIVVMNKLYQAMYGTTLRRKLLDLVPD